MKRTSKCLLKVLSVVIIISCIFPVCGVAAMPTSVQNTYWSAIVSTATGQLNKPYVYGARGPSSFDCGGLAYYVYSQNGHTISSACAADQAEGMVLDGRSVTYLEKSYLIFYDLDPTYNGRYLGIDHVAIYIGNGYIIDASSSSGKVVKRAASLMQSSMVVEARPELYL